MQKNIRKQKEIKKVRSIKKKRNRKPTACVDKRRDLNHCGICGSPDIAIHGVSYCKYCDKETDWQLLGPGESANSKYKIIWRWSRLGDYPCDCHKQSRWHLQKTYSVQACLSCGSVNGPRCPNCKQEHWFHPIGDKHYCRRCGFRK